MGPTMVERSAAPMHQQTPTWFALLLLAVVIGTFALILLGGYVKALGAGLACPDWPTCEGGTLTDTESETPYSDQQVAAEVIHRAVASVVGVLVILAAIAAWRLPGVLRTARLLIFASLPLLAVQVLLGGRTVTGGLEPLVVTAHLGTATVFFTLWVVAATLTLVANGLQRTPPEAVVN